MQQRHARKDDIGPVLTNSSLSGSRALTEPDLEKTDTGLRTVRRLTMRGTTDDLPETWWFASTAIPLLAATIGPLANILSIAALVTSWRDELANNGELPDGTDEQGVGIPDPRWELILNGISLGCGFVGNLFLLFNFTKRVRYIIALPMSIIFWFLATGILTGIIIAMYVYSPPVAPGETYSQGYWHAVLAAILYMIGAVILMINMLGYFLGHYRQHFELSDPQRTLILQTMMFFFWLAGGAAVFSKVCGFSYADALYFCDVTVLTVGFGDFSPTNDTGRGLVFPYTVIGIIFLGLMISSIRDFAVSMSKDKVIKAHALHERARAFGRTVTNEKELRERLGLPPRPSSDARRQSDPRKGSAVNRAAKQRRLDSLSQYGQLKVHGRTVTFHEYKAPVSGGGRGGAGRTYTPKRALSRDEKMRSRASSTSSHSRRADRRKKLLMLIEEKDRFDAMREIQQNTRKFKQYYALSMSVLAFSVLWFMGAVVFMLAEQREQNMTYFQSLYFCYVSLLTIGYGDFSPRSNIGKPFFVVWSLIAVPTMTILISDMSDTIVSSINRGTFTLADWTVMPRQGVWHDFLENHPRLKTWIEKKNKQIQERKRLKRGFTIADPDMDVEGANFTHGSSFPPNTPATLEQLAAKDGFSDHELARKLAITIKSVAQDLHARLPKKYSYEEWVEFTRLIRFSAKSKEEVEELEEDEGIINWDWIGEDSPMLADMTESEWVLDRLCESLNRYTRRQAHNAHHNQSASQSVQKRSSKQSLSLEKDALGAPGPKGEDEEAKLSSENGNSRVKAEEREAHHEAHEHWHGFEHEHGSGPSARPMKLHAEGKSRESREVMEWEAKVARSREVRKHAGEEEDEEQQSPGPKTG